MGTDHYVKYVDAFIRLMMENLSKYILLNSVPEDAGE
jgi:hypothetical protein